MRYLVNTEFHSIYDGCPDQPMHGVVRQIKDGNYFVEWLYHEKTLSESFRKNFAEWYSEGLLVDIVEKGHLNNFTIVLPQQLDEDLFII